jgi:pimeloyl-ACP methyl ester carboxylesterase
MVQVIIVVGGYNSLWPSYLKMARDLEDLSGLQAIGVPLMPWHWWESGRVNNATNLLQKLQETVEWARRRLRADRFVLVGHSAGGVIARLYLHTSPVWGHVYAGVEHVGAVITLGSPHCSERETGTGWFLTDEANRLVPGTFHAEQVRYRAVASHYLHGNQNGNHWERRAFSAYGYFTGRGDVWGDGMVPVQSALLDGAETKVLEGIAHSRKLGRNWYGGSKAIIRHWWFTGGPDAQ